MTHHMPQAPRQTAKPRRDAIFSVRITPGLKADLERLAAEDERTLATYVERILREHVAARTSRQT